MRMREAALGTPPIPSTAGPEVLASSASALTGQPCGQFIQLPVSATSTQSQINATSELNCFNGGTFPYGFADNTAYETNSNMTYLTPKDYKYTESYTGVPSLSTLATKSTVTANIGKFHYVDASSYAEDSLGNSYSLYTSFQLQAITTNPTLSNVTHPADYTGDGIVRNCIKRAVWAGDGDCDYATVDATGVPTQGVEWAPPQPKAVGVAKMKKQPNGTWKADIGPENQWLSNSTFSQYSNLYVPLTGTFDAGIDGTSDCIISAFTLGTKATMTLDSGGWCVNTQPNNGTAFSNDFFNSIKSTTGHRTARYNLLADFGPDCLPFALNSAMSQPVRVTVTIVAQTTPSDMSPDKCGIRILPPNTIIKMDYKSSCFAKGTGILRADGKYTAVEEMRVGQKVIANDQGLALSVVSIGRGGEDHPLVQLFDSAGHSVLLTEHHPVITATGVLPADQVREGAMVETERGTAIITEVSRVKYDDAVYNLTLGTPEELARMIVDDRTMFAGGIRVGDNQMQFELEHHGLAPRPVAADWYADYDNALARSARFASKE
jgi:hypothetical protein